MNGRKDSILAAGDYADELERLVIGLRAEEFNVLPIENRDSIVTLARSEPPSLILLDFKSGFDLCRMLKRSFITEHIPIIMLLSPAEEVDRVVALELGADDCLGKPFSFRELLLRIRCSLLRARDKAGKARFRRGQHYAALTKGKRPSGASEEDESKY